VIPRVCVRWLVRAFFADPHLRYITA
jgi:hypothetical protein